MLILRDTDSCPETLKGAALAIGNFDGVHRGHQAVLLAALDAGRSEGTTTGVMTFEPHPRSFFQPDKPLFRLTPPALKLRLFEALGLDLAIVLPFDAALAARPAAAFVREILVDGLAVAHVVTGSDFQFGKGRDGDAEMLRGLGTEHDFDVTIVPPQEGEGGVYSSSAIREHLRQGNPRAAANLLGYWWRVSGSVVVGDKRGHGLGFPTANLALPDGFALKHGIYAVRVHADGERYDGAAYLGTRPSFDDGAPAIETFLFDYSGDLYGTEIELELIELLRGDEKFESAEALAVQMKKDCEKAREVLARFAKNDPMCNLPLAKALG